jgi:hypothetical protein
MIRLPNLKNLPALGVAAIDPGLSGGIAIAHPSGSVDLHPMPEDLSEIGHIIPICMPVCIEKVPPFVGRAIPSSASFKLGHNFGWLIGYCAGRQNPLILVTPQTWQAGLGIPKGDKSQSQWKTALKAEASRRFPSVDGLTLKTADALLILEWYCREHFN